MTKGDEAMSQPSAIVFDLARCSIHDGPGIRTTVFLKGCSMDCSWCHNPESKSFSPQESINPSNGSRRIIGTKMTVAQVMATVVKDIDYYTESGGGLTISGGECLMQPAFTAALAKSAKEAGIHVTIETAGMVPWHNFEKVLPYVDLFIYDYKDSDAKRLTRTTKGDAGIIERNFTKLYDLDRPILRRCLIVPGINDTQDHIKAICRMSMIHCNDNYSSEILLYHNLGVSKSKNIGIESQHKDLASFDTKENVQRIAAMIKSYPHHRILLNNQYL